MIIFFVFQSALRWEDVSARVRGAVPCVHPVTTATIGMKSHCYAPVTDPYIITLTVTVTYTYLVWHLEVGRGGRGVVAVAQWWYAGLQVKRLILHLGHTKFLRISPGYPRCRSLQCRFVA